MNTATQRTDTIPKDKTDSAFVGQALPSKITKARIRKAKKLYNVATKVQMKKFFAVLPTLNSPNSLITESQSRQHL